MKLNIVVRCVASSALAAALSGCAAPRVATARYTDPAAAAIGSPVADAEPDAEIEDPPEAASRREAVPTAAEIFDFHPPGSRAGTWREPFVVSYTEGPLNAYRLRTLAELRSLRDHRYDLVPPSTLAVR